MFPFPLLIDFSLMCSWCIYYFKIDNLNKIIYLIRQGKIGKKLFKFSIKVGSMVEWLKFQDGDQHGLGSKPTCAILLCSWERHFTALSPAWWSWQAVLNYSNISIKLLADSNVLASLEAGQGNCLPYV